MKIAVFGSKKYDTESFDNALKSMPGAEDIEFTYLEVGLNKTTTVLATGHDTVCLFVNDDCDKEVLEHLSSLGVKYIALRCAGFNNVNLADANRLGIKVVNVPAYSPDGVAEFAVGMIMTVVRKYHKAYLRVREGNFLLDGLTGFNLFGKTVGIVGTGKIGLLTGKILSKGFGCNVIAYDLYPNKERAEQHGVTYVETLDDLLKQSDIISLHCPLSPQTKHMINERTLALTKKGVVLINTSRGALIDTTALIHSLKSGHLGAVGLDVIEKESAYFYADSSSKIIYDDNVARLLSFYNVFISGHQAFLTTEALKNIAETTVSNLLELKEGGPLTNEVKG